MKMNGYRVGIFYRGYMPVKKSPLNFWLQLGAGALLSDLIIAEETTGYGIFSSDYQILSGTGIYLEMVGGASLHIYKNLYTSIGYGYEGDFKGALKRGALEPNSSAKWNGFRLYGSILFLIPIPDGN
jgi:hypothetical protein